MRAIFLNTGWMRFYRGLDDVDKIVGGGSHVDKHGEGGEVYNFLDRDGTTYGYVQPSRGTISVSRLGASCEDSSLGDVLVVWIATYPGYGPRIVGWYRNATIHRNVQSLRVKKNGKLEFVHYFVEAKTRDCHWLDIDERVFEIPRRVKGGMGQSNVWYADGTESISIRKAILEYINRGIIPRARRKTKKSGGHGYPTDPETRAKIEQAAITQVTDYYTSLGYTVESVESENLGWDLNVELGHDYLKVEVKGKMYADIQFELTPNEYVNMLDDRRSYRIAVVTNALSKKPTTDIFSYTPERNKWMSKNGKELEITEKKGAIVRA